MDLTTSSLQSIGGIIPVMLTPFRADGKIDEEGLSNLVEWYLGHGAEALFAVCQSSEMQYLDLEERMFLARQTMALAGNRAPVVVSGHVSTSEEDQRRELRALADLGPAALVLVTNRIDPENGGRETFLSRLQQILNWLPADLPLGLYECPAPFRRLLDDEEFCFCANSGRFVLLKDVSCDLLTVRRRVALAQGTPLAVVNANAAIAHEAFRAGSHGFGGVFTNFHPDLYAWLHAHRHEASERVDELARFLALAAMAEPMGYPRLAKLYHKRIGTISCDFSRVIDYDIGERHWAAEVLLDHIAAGTERFRARIAQGEPE
ncbi:dihydrodipicolinate synthase family protein [Pseudohoeflea coraliihabitans]|uniref:Dihydrodipicolinate synthase family protein n=1 Tax=Pseudohoeflea coraliihabitans TaxID=2860393 RepID=A0ABS6WJB6_9HYPH|nr:dihydrodipicolinate synthase family protein [Pseudohoeflea sp. DP4N28-3]MBW3096036.1 dihydrodipicolinate synthase family protein [Pseudohoeflea sp. DP4N28-3]